MKKYLLILILALGVTIVNAQTTTLKTISPAGGVATKPDKAKIYPELTQPGQLPSANRLRSSHPMRTTTYSIVDNTFTLGSAGNAFGAGFGTRTNLWYDPNLNTVMYFHRSDMHATPPWPDISSILIDYSTDGGDSWPTVNQGPVYKAGSGDTHRGRYPQGVIYNPSGNTTASNAYANTYGPVTDGTNWIENFEGTLPIGSSTDKQQLWSAIQGGGSLGDIIPEGMQIVKNTGTNWVVANGTLSTGYSDDSIFLAKGTYTGSGDFNYDFSKTFSAPITDTAGISDIATAWSDDGMTGYVVQLANDTDPAVSSNLEIVVYKTTNGGDNWTKITSSNNNMNINVLDGVLANGGYASTTAFDVDCAVDKNNNLHIAISIGASAGGYSISTAYGNWGVFDIYTTDQGTTWYGQIVALPESFRCTYGANTTQDPTVAEDNRPQVTRSWDGSKIFISWFDTDTAEFGPGNCSPDWHLRAYDVDRNLWTDSLNMTDGTFADGFCSFSSVSYYSRTNGSMQCIPMVYGSLQSISSTGESETFNYAHGACVDSVTDYTMMGHPCLLSITGGACALPAFSIVNGINELKNSVFTVSANYPNPFDGATMVDVTLTKTENVTIEVSNMLGQVLSSKTYNNLSAGKSHLTINASDLAAGIYLYKVTVGGEMVARTMAVK